MGPAVCDLRQLQQSVEARDEMACSLAQYGAFHLKKDSTAIPLSCTSAALVRRISRDIGRFLLSCLSYRCRSNKRPYHVETTKVNQQRQT